MKISVDVKASGFAGVMRRVARLVTATAARTSRSPRLRPTDQSREPRP
jgi:hypothetical protein